MTIDRENVKLFGSAFGGPNFDAKHRSDAGQPWSGDIGRCAALLDFQYSLLPHTTLHSMALEVVGRTGRFAGCHFIRKLSSWLS